ncbi:MAG: hypothetical protein HKN85_07690 [Gammaproteobacteria bacterium]|nr:hypothetical protein [Gammaproteobacteria bacterium]
MNAAEILYPAFAMFALTIGCVFALGRARYRAIHNGDVKISYFRTYDQGTQPARLHLLARHVQNHFEIPPLFYVGVTLSYVTGGVGLPGIVCAWLFVAARFLHSWIHLGSNNVSFRFFTFGSSLVFLVGLWLTLFYRLLVSSALA